MNDSFKSIDESTAVVRCLFGYFREKMADSSCARKTRRRGWFDSSSDEFFLDKWRASRSRECVLVCSMMRVDSECWRRVSVLFRRLKMIRCYRWLLFKVWSADSDIFRSFSVQNGVFVLFLALPLLDNRSIVNQACQVDGRMSVCARTMIAIGRNSLERSVVPLEHLKWSTMIERIYCLRSEVRRERERVVVAFRR